MKKIKIDGKEFDIDSLSEDSKRLISSLQFVQTELLRSQAMTASLQTAQSAYARSLKQLLSNVDAETLDTDILSEELGDTISFEED